jgi:hypothetical protein
MLKKVEVRKVMRMKRKGLRVIRKGAVLEGELPKALQQQGPKWAKSWPKIRLVRRTPTKHRADARRCARSAAGLGTDRHQTSERKYR